MSLRSRDNFHAVENYHCTNLIVSLNAQPLRIRRDAIHDQIQEKYLSNYRGYPPQTRIFASPGEFRAYIAGSANRKYSAAAWLVEKIDGSENQIEDVKASDSKSSAPRAVLRGIIRALECTASNSTLTLFLAGQQEVDAINSDLEVWESKGWRGSNGPVKNRELLETILVLIRAKNLKVFATKASEEVTASEVVERLKLKANSELNKATNPPPLAA